MKNSTLIGLLTVFFLLTGPAYAAETKDNTASKDSADARVYPRVPLAEILEVVSKKTGKKFLVDARVSPTVVTGQLRERDITYSTFLAILRNNGLAAATVGEIISVVPVATIRQHALPVLFDDDDSIDDEEWVTRVMPLENVIATQMVPIMRPLLPQQGHMAANPASNTIIIVDRYANVRRVTQVLLKLDSLTPPQDSRGSSVD